MARNTPIYPTRWRAGALIVAACVSALPGLAQVEVPGVVVSASRLPTAATGLAQSVSVISGEELRALGTVSTKAALSTAVGIHVDQVGKAGGFSSVYIRGAEQSHLLVLIDGIRVNDATTTRGSAFDLSEIDLASIERIEVLRGPGSAVHGGEALAGVINIVTKQGAEGKPQGSVHAGIGEFGYRKAGAQVGGGTSAARYSFTAGHEASGEHDAEQAFQRLNTIGASAQFTPTATSALDLTLRHARRKSEEFPDGSGGEQFAIVRTLERKEARDTIVGLGFSIGDARNLRFEARASLFDREEESKTPDIIPLDPILFPVPARTDDTDFKRKSLQLALHRSFQDLVDFVVGGEFQQEDGTLLESLIGLADGRTELKRDTRSLFAEASVSPSTRFSVQIGVRHDSFDGGGLLDAPGLGISNSRLALEKQTQTTPHVGAVWTLPNATTTLKASFSRGFKAPSFFALGNFLVGRTDLKPERSRNVELALQQKLSDHGTLNVSAFRVKYRDLVDLVADPAAIIGLRLTNRGTIVSTGIEPSATLRLADRWRVRGGLTLMDLDVRDGKEDLPNRPEKKAFLTAVFDLNDRHALSATANYVGASVDQPQVVSGDVRLGGYTTVDVAWNTKLGWAQLTLAVDNLLDKDYQQFFGFENFGRRFRLDARAHF